MRVHGSWDGCGHECLFLLIQAKSEYQVQVEGERRKRGHKNMYLSLFSLGLHTGCHNAMLSQLRSEDLILCFPFLHLLSEHLVVHP